MRCCCSGLAVWADCADRAEQLAHRGSQVEMARLDTFGDLIPRRADDLLGDGPALLGELEELLAAFGFGADDQSLVDEQLQGGVDRTGAGLPYVTGALGDLLDHLVAVHRPFGQQGQDRGPDVTAPAAAAAVSTTTAPPARAEAGTEAWPEAEPGAEAAAWTETGRTVAAGHLPAHLIAEMSPSVPTCGARRGEAEAAEAGAAHLRAVELGKWGVHESFSFSIGNAECASDTSTIYRKLS